MNLIQKPRVEAGFTLMETMIAIVVLAVGVLGLAAMLADSLTYMNTSQVDYIAQQKAVEAVESVFTARDIGQATWSSICNVSSTVCANGVFLNGAQTLCDPGPDGILGTSDDYSGSTCAVAADAILQPTSAGVLNVTSLTNANRVPLSNYRFLRTITITNVANVTNLRQIQVTISYRAGKFQRSYTLTTNISNFS
jgi:prepilin-type N-terminal cleavage/methylation domain-containing protein